MTSLTAQPSMVPLRLDLKDLVEFDDRGFFELCRRNPELRLEGTASKEIVMMSPAGGRTSSRSSKITRQLDAWAERDGSGASFDSSGGFQLPNGAVRSPDAAWVELARLRALAVGTAEQFLPLCPTFVIELLSPSDSLPVIERKMQEYLDSGCSLGWLIEPYARRVRVYRPLTAIEILEVPMQVSADPELPGFVLKLERIWEPGW